MRVNHVRRDWYQMVSAAGNTSATITPTTAPVRSPWTLNKIPTRNGKYFAYVPKIWLIVDFTVDQPAAGGSIIYDEQLAAIVSSFELKRTKMGTLFLSSDTSGPRLHSFDNRIMNGYRHAAMKTPSIAAADGDTVRRLYLPITFSHGCNEKPHHFAPPAALLNGSLLDIFFDAAAKLGDFSTGAVWKSATAQVVVEVLWEPEARLHVPLRHGLYEPQASGANQRWELDLGGKGGLDGVDAGGGSGLLAMAIASSKAGLGGTITVDEVTKIAAPFLNLDTLDVPEILSMEFVQSLDRQPGEFYPFIESASTTVAKPHTSDQLFFPIVMPPKRMELSKVSMVGGKQELQVGFGSAKSQATHKLYTQEVFAWDPAFILAARDLIFGDRAEASRYVPSQKFSRKQSDVDKEVMDDSKKRFLPWRFIPAA